MGFLDTAKHKLKNATKNFTEETIRITDYEDDEEEYEEPTPEPQPKQKRGRKTRTPKPRKQKLSKEEENSAFNIEEHNTFFEDQDRIYQEKMKELSNVKVPKAREGRIQDVLELLDIPATFEIPPEIFMVEDLKEISFDLQVPQGYEMGQVNAFIEQAKKTVEGYIKLLKARNKHIMQLATTIDRMQVDYNNMKLELELANGISIMPTSDSDELEKENFELRTLVKRLQEELETRSEAPIDDRLSSQEREAFDAIQDELSVQRRENDELLTTIQELKTAIAQMEEDAFDNAPPQESVSGSQFDLDDALSIEEIYPNNDNNENQWAEEVIEEALEGYNETSISEPRTLPTIPQKTTRQIPMPSIPKKQNPAPNTLPSPDIYEDDDDIFKDLESSSHIDAISDNGETEETELSGTYYDKQEELDLLDELFDEE